MTYVITVFCNYNASRNMTLKTCKHTEALQFGLTKAWHIPVCFFLTLFSKSYLPMFLCKLQTQWYRGLWSGTSDKTMLIDKLLMLCNKVIEIVIPYIISLLCSSFVRVVLVNYSDTKIVFSLFTLSIPNYELLG